MRRAMHVLTGQGPQEESTFYDHPYFGQLFLGFPVYTANNIDDRSKVSAILSSNIHLNIKVDGITAKRTDDIRATFLL